MKAIVITDWVSVAVCAFLVILALMSWWSAAEYYRASHELVVNNCRIAPVIYYEVDTDVSIENSEDREWFPVSES